MGIRLFLTQIQGFFGKKSGVIVLIENSAEWLIPFSRSALGVFLALLLHPWEAPQAQPPAGAAISGRLVEADGPPRFESRRYALSEGTHWPFLALDVDGDGRTELLNFSDDSDPAGKQEAPQLIELVGDVLSSGRALQPLDTGCRWSHRRAADIDSDGKDELLGIAIGRKALCVGSFRGNRFETVRILPQDPHAAELPGQISQFIGRAAAPGRYRFFAQIGDAANLLGYEIDLRSARYAPLPLQPFSGNVWIRETGDTRGDLLRDLLGRPNHPNRHLIVRCSDVSRCEAWLHFPESSGVLIPSFGDFDGDGKIDAVLPGDATTGSWLGLAGVHGGIEQEFVNPGLPVQLDAKAPPGLLQVADLNGDGRDELIMSSENGKELLSWQLESFRPVAGVSVELDSVELDSVELDSVESNTGGADAIPPDGGQRTVSDTNGLFRFFPVAPGAHVLTVSRPGHRVVSRRVNIAGGTTEKAVNIPLEPRRAESRAGAAVGLYEDPDGPAVCTGYLPEAAGQYTKWGMLEDGSCPRGYAIMAVEFQRAVKRLLIPFAATSASFPPLKATCCKLPSPDILRDETVVSSSVCPEGFVATGVKRVAGEQPGSQLRCTKINTERYVLGPAGPGVYWGNGVDRDSQHPRTTHDRIPPAFREAVGRLSFQHWQLDGCLGAPWGSLLVSSAINRCSAFGFRELRERGKDPAATARPVPIFPACDALENPFDPLSGCRPHTVENPQH